MVRDEAPAATSGGINEIGATASEPAWPGGPASVRESGPNSFVAAEIHLGSGPAGIYDDRPHRNIQVACHAKSLKILFYFK
jgi:hypothetical protein